MKKIINGKVYDTDTAQLIAEAHHDNIRDAYGTTTKQWLYRKRTGEFFLHVEGVSYTLHNMWQTGFRPGRGIYPLTFEEARKFVEAELSAEKWIKIFGEPDENGEAVTLGIQVSAAAAAKLKQEAAKIGIPQGKLLDQWILNA